MKSNLKQGNKGGVKQKQETSEQLKIIYFRKKLQMQPYKGD